jgi:hypothetical protein
VLVLEIPSRDFFSVKRGEKSSSKLDFVSVYCWTLKEFSRLMKHFFPGVTKVFFCANSLENSVIEFIFLMFLSNV